MRVKGGVTMAGRAWRRESPRSRGFTLIEIMVALLLGLVVLGGVAQVFISTRQAVRIQQASSRMQENGRNAIALLARYIRMSGYSTFPWDKGQTNWDPTHSERGYPASPSDDPFAEGQVVRGIGATESGNINGVDSIRIRYPGAADNMITTCLGRVVPVNEMADITLSLTANDPVAGRSLQCTDNNTSPIPQPLVAGLQDMRIWYAVSQDPAGGGSGMDAVGRLTGATAYLPADQVTARSLWNRVIGVQISLLVRSDENNVASQPQTYRFPITNGVPTTPSAGDQRLRQVVGTTITVRNQAN